MNSQELLSLLIREAAEIPVEDFIRTDLSSTQYAYSPGSMRYIAAVMNRYNLEVFYEIKNRKDIPVLENIRPHVFKDFTFRIDRYMDENAPGQENFKRYIRLISTYLAFIAKKSLHPPGMVISEGIEIAYRNGEYYCPLKNKQLQERFSLCAYCVGKDNSEMK